MIRVACIVEGHGEVVAVPLLLRRLAVLRTPLIGIEISQPIRVHRDRFLNRDEEFSRYLRLAGSKCGEQGWVLVLLDADDDCPAQLGAQTLERARSILPEHSISVVFANREFESWFIGAAASLTNFRGFVARPADLTIDPEVPRDAKGWIRERVFSRSYGETTDQPAFAARMDIQQAIDRCRSFRKLSSEWDRHSAILGLP